MDSKFEFRFTDDEDVRIFTQSSTKHLVTELNISYVNRISNQGYETLFKSIPQLKKLISVENNLDLTLLPNLTQLEELDISYHLNFELHDLEPLSKLTELKKLVANNVLYLDSCLQHFNSLSKLRFVDLRETGVSRNKVNQWLDKFSRDIEILADDFNEDDNDDSDKSGDMDDGGPDIDDDYSGDDSTADDDNSGDEDDDEVEDDL